MIAKFGLPTSHHRVVAILYEFADSSVRTTVQRRAHDLDDARDIHFERNSACPFHYDETSV
jgi:hypothetical protein